MVFFDVVFFSAIAPLLPEYVAELGLSKAEAGILSASYAAGTLFFALPSGFLAARIGAKRTVISGLLLLGCASVVFGFAHEYVLLGLARFFQGMSGALIWTGALTWLVTSAESEHRGAVIGTALGTAVGGALVGPALGALAGEVGTEVVFTGVLGVAVLLAVLASGLKEREVPEQEDLRVVAETILSRPVLIGTFFVMVPSVMFGAVEVLAPLRIADLGGGHSLIAAGFIAGAALEALLAPLAGRYSDRAGRRAPYTFGLTVCAVAVITVAVGATMGAVMAGLMLTSLGGGVCFTPALTMLTEVAESSRLHQGFAAGLSNTAWASGQVAGGLVAGGVAGLAGDATPAIGIAVLLVFTAAYAYATLAPPPVQPAEGGG
jgi:MFS family permease